MSIRANSALTVAPLGRNEILSVNLLVPAEVAFLKALKANPSGLRIADGSVYEPAPVQEGEQFAELDVEYVNGVKVSLLRDPAEAQLYHVAIGGKYQHDESTDDLGQARRNFEGVQAEIWDARRDNR